MADPSDDDEEKPIRRDHTVHSSTGGTYCFSDVASSGKHSTLQTPILQSFEPTSSEIYNFTSRSMEMMMLGFQSPKNHLQQEHNSSTWKGLIFFDKPGNNIDPSSSKGINDQFYRQQHNLFTGTSDRTANEPLNDMVSRNDSYSHHVHGFENRSSSMVLDDSSLRCVFPCEANERPGQGLSLSLNSSNPSSIGLQSFELRRHDLDLMRFGSSSSSSRSANDVQHLQQSFELSLGQFLMIRNSKYLGPAQEFLNELCSLGTKQTAGKMKARENNEHWEDEKSDKKQELYSLDLVELQRRKTKLLHMLEEVDIRYKHYRNQMKAVVSSLESVAGNGSAMVYSALASKAMSRHFRCLRDGIVRQIKATKKVIGDNYDTNVSPGIIKSDESSRTGILDQTMGQRKPLQLQMSMMETYPLRRRRGLPERQVSVLRAWLFEHFLHPYPSDADKQILASQTGLSRSQVSNWYINARVRLWKPIVEQLYIDELNDEQEANHNNVAASSSNPNLDHQHLQSPRNDDDQHQKPTTQYCQLVRIDQSAFVPNVTNSDVMINNDPSQYSDGKSGVSLSLGLNHHQNVITRSSLFYNPATAGYEDHSQNLQYSLVDSNDQGLGFDWNAAA